MKIELKDICKSFGKDFNMQHMNMCIESNQFTTFLGPSGCGKTTILRMIAGLETPDLGEIWFDDKCVFSSEKRINIPPEKRNLGFVFQDFALWPHMTVYENVEFPLKARKCKDNIEETVMQALRSVKLEKYAKRYPSQLSGGQQQRVAFARAIAGKVDLLLFDEPLSALDAILRDEMRREIKSISDELGITSIFVTHDQAEAMSLSDKVYVLNQGKIEQYGTPQEVYCDPKSRFVAKFIGKSNWINDKSMFRPEDASLTPLKGCTAYETLIKQQLFLGNMYEIRLQMDDQAWVVYTTQKQLANRIPVYIENKNIKVFSNENIA